MAAATAVLKGIALSRPVTFVTGNAKKLEEVRAILGNSIPFQSLKLDCMYFLLYLFISSFIFYFLFLLIFLGGFVLFLWVFDIWLFLGCSAGATRWTWGYLQGKG